MRIYLDNAATTQPKLKKTLDAHMESAWFNPSAPYAPAEAVYIAMKQTRRLLAEMILPGAQVVFASGGTEANNIAVFSAFKKGAHYITSAVEHPSVYSVFRQLEQMGASVDYIRPCGHCVLPEDVAKCVRSDTALVSVMHVNNETGALNDIRAIADAVKARNPKTKVHADGVQALGKVNTDMTGSGVDYYTVSAHKIHALKGTGALIAAQGCAVKPMCFGGEQEQKLRPGTENTLGIQAFDEALHAVADGFETAGEKVAELSQRMIDGLGSIEGAMLNRPDCAVPHIVNVSFAGVRSEVLVRALGEQGILIGTGAACSKGKLSRVLLESGVSRKEAEGAVRISLSAYNTEKEIDICLEALAQTVASLARLGRR